jgi:hypothetical protein
MDQVAAYPFTREQFDHELAAAITDWASLPELAAAWEDWDDDSRLGLLLDWPVIEERTARVLALEATLTPGDDRATQLRRLRDLVDQNRPTLARLRPC